MIYVLICNTNPAGAHKLPLLSVSHFENKVKFELFEFRASLLIRTLVIGALST